MSVLFEVNVVGIPSKQFAPLKQPSDVEADSSNEFLNVVKLFKCTGMADTPRAEISKINGINSTKRFSFSISQSFNSIFAS